MAQAFDYTNTIINDLQRFTILTKITIRVIESLGHFKLFLDDLFTFSKCLFFVELYCAPQEWEVFTGLLVSEVRNTTSELREGLPKWIDEDRVLAVSMLQVSSL